MLKPVPNDARAELTFLRETLGDAQYIEQIWQWRQKRTAPPSSKGWPYVKRDDQKPASNVRRLTPKGQSRQSQ